MTNDDDLTPAAISVKFKTSSAVAGIIEHVLHGWHHPCLGQPTDSPMDHPLLNLEIRRFIRRLYSAMSRPLR
ncbi:hypothetical protein LB504_000775 [Fusarium proliferatum]|nr:hypothetical protein LB504_000775 [Fusarium proliferatum]